MRDTPSDPRSSQLLRRDAGYQSYPADPHTVERDAAVAAREGRFALLMPKHYGLGTAHHKQFTEQHTDKF